MQKIKEDSMKLFDAIAVGGVARPSEFAVIVQKYISQMMKNMLADLSDAPFYPAALRAVDHLDTTGLKPLVDMLFRVIDANGNGVLDRNELLVFLSGIESMPTQPSLVLDYFFALADRNQNGKISLGEAQNLVHVLYELITAIIVIACDVGDSVLNSREVNTMLDDGLHESLFPMLDTNHDGVISKAEFQNSQELRSGIGMLAQVISGSGPMGADPAMQMQRQQMIASVKQVRANLATLEQNVGAQFYMQAMDFMKGGVDEATFLSKLVPLMRDELGKTTPNASDTAQASQQLLGPLQMALPPPVAEMVVGAVGQFSSSQNFQTALLIAKDKAGESVPEFCRAIFKLLDLDGNGTISSREMSALKAILDAILHIGDRAIQDPVPGAAVHFGAAQNGAFGMYPGMAAMQAQGQSPTAEAELMELALAIFGVIDRDGDGVLRQEEFVAFLTKLGSFYLALIRMFARGALDSYLQEISKAAVAEAWAAAGMQEVSKEEIQPLLMMGPVMMGGMMMGGESLGQGRPLQPQMMTGPPQMVQPQPQPQQPPQMFPPQPVQPIQTPGAQPQQCFAHPQPQSPQPVKYAAAPTYAGAPTYAPMQAAPQRAPAVYAQPVQAQYQGYPYQR